MSILGSSAVQAGIRFLPFTGVIFLASTAVGVVSQERAGTASGIDSTLRQIGTATSVAALGSILAPLIKDHVVTRLAATPLAARSHQLATAISSGRLDSVAHRLSPQRQGLLFGAARAGYVHALNSILLVGAIIAGLATIATLVTIRQRDFHHVGDHAAEPGAPSPEMIVA